MGIKIVYRSSVPRRDRKCCTRSDDGLHNAIAILVPHVLAICPVIPFPTVYHGKQELAVRKTGIQTLLDHIHGLECLFSADYWLILWCNWNEDHIAGDKCIQTVHGYGGSGIDQHKIVPGDTLFEVFPYPEDVGGLR